MNDSTYWGKIMRINLTDKSAVEDRLPFEVARDFIGGAGIGIKYLFDYFRICYIYHIFITINHISTSLFLSN